MSEYALEIRDYAFSYGSTGVDVLHDISFGLEGGSFAVLWGPSGSGKSTLLRALKPALAVAGSSRGTVRVLGDDPYLLSPVESASTVGFVMQDPENQIATDTVWHELAFGLESVGMDIASSRGRDRPLLRHRQLVRPKDRRPVGRTEAAAQSDGDRSHAAGRPRARRAHLAA